MPDTREPAIPAPPGAVSNFDNPEDVLHTVNLATQVVCIIVVTIAVGMRVAVKVRLRNGLGLEDCEYSSIYHDFSRCIAFNDLETEWLTVSFKIRRLQDG